MTEEVRGEFSWGAFASHVAAMPLPYVLAFIAAVSWGVYSNLAHRWLGEEGEGTVPFFMLATAAVLLALRFVFREQSTWGVRSTWEILGLSIATSGGYIGWDISMRKGNLVLVAAASYLTPLLSTLVITFYLGATAGPRLWLGCLLIVAGSFLSWMSVSDRTVEAK
jgi:drug/metabolite transporter (DMT)-like permease